MHKWCFLVLDLLFCTFALATADHPYDPHDHASNPFFEGWFIRITSSSTHGLASLAFGIGHLPDQHPSNPSAACFLIMPPGTDVSADTVRRPAINLRADADAFHYHLDISSSSSSSSNGSKGSTDAPPRGSGAVPRTFTHYFSSLDVHPSKQQALCVDCPAFVAQGSNEGGSCRLEVTGNLVSIQAEVSGAFQFSASNDPSTAAVLPWGDSPGTSPEGWLPASMLKLHWYVYSMATPIAFDLTVYESASAQQPEPGTQQQQHMLDKQEQKKKQEAAVFAAQHALAFAPYVELKKHTTEEEQQQHWVSAGLPHFELMPGTARQQQQQQHASAAVQYSGTGFAHMEKNWGDAFPEQWVWAQGNSRDGKASFVLAGGSLPIKSATLSSWINRLLTQQSLLNVPLLKPSQSTTQAQTSNSKSESSDSYASSDSYESPASIESTSAKAQGNELLAFAFSLHSPTVNLTVDPLHPSWVTQFEPCACCSSLALKLTGWGHEVVVRLEAPASSFAGLPCPTEDGFRFKTDESFAATAHVRVYGSLPSAGSRTELTRAKQQQRLLLSAFSFDGAALEFGGTLRCSSCSSTSAMTGCSMSGRAVEKPPVT